jgi:hypothetical protein
MNGPLNIAANSGIDGLEITQSGAGNGLHVTGTTGLVGNTTLTGNLDVSGTTLVTGVLTTTAATVFNGGFASNADSTLGTDKKVQFRDSAIYINSSADGQLDLVADTEIQIAATTIDVNGTLAFDSLKGTGATTVTNILDEHNMASDSATAIATQQSIKAYVDSQVGSFDTLAEVLIQGNTTGSTDIAVDSAQKVQFRDADIYINSSADGQLDIVADTEIQIAATTVDLNGDLDVSGTTLVTGVLTTTAATVHTNGITMPDNAKAIFGAGSDLEIYHDASDSIINDNGTGSLKLQQGGSTKLEVTATGIDVTGTATADKVTIGTSSASNGKLTLEGVDGADSAGIYFNNTTATNGKSYSLSSGNSGEFMLYDRTSSAYRLLVSSAGNVGIGTSSPAVPLAISATTGAITTTSSTGTNIVYNAMLNSGGGLYLGLEGNTGGGIFSGSSAYDALFGHTGAYNMHFVTSNTIKATIDAIGNVGIGTSSPIAYGTGITTLSFKGKDASYPNRSGAIVFDSQSGSGGGASILQDAGVLYFSTGSGAALAATERMRITNTGYTKMSPTGTYVSAASSYHEMYQNYAGITSYIYNGSATGDGLLINTMNENTSNFFLAGYSDSALRYNIYIYSNGNLLNRNNSYGGFSDQKLKQDIEDASRQWDDIKAMKFRKYRWKHDVAVDANAPYQLGVIAQELEAAGMSGLVEETADKEFYDEVVLDSDGNPVVDEDGNNVTEQKERLTGESTKSVKYSILTMKALVALQEAMTRIESLEARIAALES